MAADLPALRLDAKSSPPPYESTDHLGSSARAAPALRADDVDDRLPSDVDDDEFAEEDELLMSQRARHAPEVEAQARMRFRQSQTELVDFRNRFDMNRPSIWKRIVLIVFLVVVTYIAFQLRFAANEPVIHARRYSARYKYRPAASPVIQTKLPDGRIKVRGDEVGAALQAERLLRQGRPTDAVEVKGGKKRKTRKSKKNSDAKPPRQTSRHA